MRRPFWNYLHFIIVSLSALICAIIKKSARNKKAQQEAHKMDAELKT